MQTLLIIGADGHGRVVAEIAMACGYDKNAVAFLDDNVSGAVGKIENMDLHAPRYDGVFVANGNKALRKSLLHSCVGWRE